LTWNETEEECYVFEVTVTGTLLGVQPNPQIPDVMEFIEDLLQDQALTTNSPFQFAFLGAAAVGAADGDSGRDNLAPPSNLKNQEQSTAANDRQTVTIVGGLLVAAFCCAFLGIVFVLWRRRSSYLRTREVHLKLSESDLQQYDTEPHHSEPSPPSQADHEEVFPNNITFDLGTSFKDQLMGVHGVGGGSRRPPHMMGGSQFAPSNDGASDSDADSWAQTDGTIGSLELQLEPITAEV
jgi:hypothetical protein